VFIAALFLEGSASASGQAAATRQEQTRQLTLLEGSFAVVGSSPDGDSVRFYPRDARRWRAIGRVDENRRGGAQLRLEGIDALETHYAPKKGRVGVTRQPLGLAHAASAELLRWLGFRSVQRNGEKVTATEPPSVAGYILSSGADAYGRAVAFAFRGEHPGESGDRIASDPASYAGSLNQHLLAGGFAYPMFYESLGTGVRGAMARDAKTARKRRVGVWASDRTSSGFEVRASFAEVQARAFVMPKLFRRLMDYLASQDGNTSLAGFPSYLATRSERVLIASEGTVVEFASLVKVDGQTIRVTRSAEDLVFLEN
jgi:endonuclease YncB( thermonuclease family)